MDSHQKGARVVKLDSINGCDSAEGRTQSVEGCSDESCGPGGAEQSEASGVARGSAAVTLWDILALAVPSLGVLAATPLYMLIDTAVVGRLGPTDLAALGAATTILGQVTTQLTFLSYGTTSRASRFFGAGRPDRSVREGINATWVGIGVGLILATVVWLCAPSVATLLAGHTDVGHEASQWLRLAALGVPLTLVTMAGNGWMRGIQKTTLPLVFTLVGVVPSAVAVPFLVKMWGIQGSAVANLVGETITALCFGTYLVVQAKQYGLGFAPSARIIRLQLVLGRDLILRSLCFQVSFVSAAAVAGRFGQASLAGHQVLLQLWNFLALVLDSLAIAAQSLVGAALGAQNSVRARIVGRQIILYSAVCGLAIGGVLAAGWTVIPGLFTQSEQVLSAMAVPWWLLCVLVVLGGVVFALDGVLLGAGDAAFLRTATMLSAVCGFLPLVWMSLWLKWGLTGIWCGLVAFLVLRLATTATRFIRGQWAR